MVKDNYIFAATNDDGMYRSEDNGESWIMVNDGLDGSARYIHSVIENNSNLIIGTSDGIYVSSNNGEDWIKTDKLSTVYGFTKIDSTILAGITGKGIAVSNDNGKNWRSKNNGLFNKGIWCLYSDGNNLFAGTSNGYFFHPIKERTGSK